MELKPRLKLRSPIETPFRMPKSITVFASVDFDSKKFNRCATCRVQNVTMRCQLVSVVAAPQEIKINFLKKRLILINSI
jgi:hypothetical protein